jgi:gentisate 1,2-dioxygenase
MVTVSEVFVDHGIRKTPEREAFYRAIDDENLSALWNVMGDLITP